LSFRIFDPEPERHKTLWIAKPEATEVEILSPEMQLKYLWMKAAAERMAAESSSLDDEPEFGESPVQVSSAPKLKRRTQAESDRQAQGRAPGRVTDASATLDAELATMAGTAAPAAKSEREESRARRRADAPSRKIMSKNRAIRRPGDRGDKGHIRAVRKDIHRAARKAKRNARQQRDSTLQRDAAKARRAVRDPGERRKLALQQANTLRGRVWKMISIEVKGKKTKARDDMLESITNTKNYETLLGPEITPLVLSYKGATGAQARDLRAVLEPLLRAAGNRARPVRPKLGRHGATPAKFTKDNSHKQAEYAEFVRQEVELTKEDLRRPVPFVAPQYPEVEEGWARPRRSAKKRSPTYREKREGESAVTTGTLDEAAAAQLAADVDAALAAFAQAKKERYNQTFIINPPPLPKDKPRLIQAPDTPAWHCTINAVSDSDFEAILLELANYRATHSRKRDSVTIRFRAVNDPTNGFLNKYLTRIGVLTALPQSIPVVATPEARVRVSVNKIAHNYSGQGEFYLTYGTKNVTDLVRSNKDVRWRDLGVGKRTTIKLVPHRRLIGGGINDRLLTIRKHIVEPAYDVAAQAKTMANDLANAMLGKPPPMGTRGPLSAGWNMWRMATDPELAAAMQESGAVWAKFFDACPVKKVKQLGRTLLTAAYVSNGGEGATPATNFPRFRELDVTTLDRIVDDDLRTVLKTYNDVITTMSPSHVLLDVTRLLTDAIAASTGKPLKAVPNTSWTLELPEHATMADLAALFENATDPGRNFVLMVGNTNVCSEAIARPFAPLTAYNINPNDFVVSVRPLLLGGMPRRRPRRPNQPAVDSTDDDERVVPVPPFWRDLDKLTTDATVVRVIGATAKLRDTAAHSKDWDNDLSTKLIFVSPRGTLADDIPPFDTRLADGLSEAAMRGRCDVYYLPVSEELHTRPTPPLGDALNHVHVVCPTLSRDYGEFESVDGKSKFLRVWDGMVVDKAASAGFALDLVHGVIVKRVLGGALLAALDSGCHVGAVDSLCLYRLGGPARNIHWGISYFKFSVSRGPFTEVTTVSLPVLESSRRIVEASSTLASTPHNTRIVSERIITEIRKSCPLLLECHPNYTALVHAGTVVTMDDAKEAFIKASGAPSIPFWFRMFPPSTFRKTRDACIKAIGEDHPLPLWYVLVTRVAPWTLTATAVLSAAFYWSRRFRNAAMKRAARVSTAAFALWGLVFRLPLMVRNLWQRFGPTTLAKVTRDEYTALAQDRSVTFIGRFQPGTSLNVPRLDVTKPLAAVSDNWELSYDDKPITAKKLYAIYASIDLPPTTSYIEPVAFGIPWNVPVACLKDSIAILLFKLVKPVGGFEQQRKTWLTATSTPLRHLLAAVRGRFPHGVPALSVEEVHQRSLAHALESPKKNVYMGVFQKHGEDVFCDPGITYCTPFTPRDAPLPTAESCIEHQQQMLGDLERLIGNNVPSLKSMVKVEALYGDGKTARPINLPSPLGTVLSYGVHAVWEHIKPFFAGEVFDIFGDDSLLTMIYMCPGGAQDKLGAVFTRFMNSPNVRFCVMASGDDSLILCRFGRAIIWVEGDFSTYDRTARLPVLTASLAFARMFGLPYALAGHLLKNNASNIVIGSEPTVRARSTDWRLTACKQTGETFTSGGHTIATTAAILEFLLYVRKNAPDFFRVDTPCSPEDLDVPSPEVRDFLADAYTEVMANCGFSAKVEVGSVHENRCAATFLKGWWNYHRETDVWFWSPFLPSALPKRVGKLILDPDRTFPSFVRRRRLRPTDDFDCADVYLGDVRAACVLWHRDWFADFWCSRLPGRGDASRYDVRDRGASTRQPRVLVGDRSDALWFIERRYGVSNASIMSLLENFPVRLSGGTVVVHPAIHAFVRKDYM
jgi:hypothetical protein